MSFVLPSDPWSRRQDLLHTLERLLEIQALDLPSTLDQAAQLVVEALQADKVDAFLYDPAIDSLVSVGTSDTPMGQRQKALGLDRMPLANGGRTVVVYQTGESFLTGRTEQDPLELPGMIHGLGIRSSILAPLQIGQERRGVVSAVSATPDFFSEPDLHFLEAVSHWIGVVAHRAELTEQVTQQAAEHGRRMAAEELVTVLAHDLRNHVALSRGRLQLLQRRAQREDRAKDVQDAAEALKGLDRLTRLIENLLDASRLESGLFTLYPLPTDLVALAHEAAEAVTSPGAEIHLQAPPELTILVDPDRIRQLLENLLSNAVKHSPEGQPVRLEIDTEKQDSEEWATIQVIDQGPGISPEVLPHLFERFATGPRSTGLGLGLYLASRIASAHGGMLDLCSVPGSGVCFEVRLPLAAHTAIDSR